MKLRKFFGLTSRSVLEQVRAELGPDAVIVANRPTADGIEITALAGDAIESILEQPGPRDTTAAATATPAPAAATTPPATSGAAAAQTPAAPKAVAWDVPRISDIAAEVASAAAHADDRDGHASIGMAETAQVSDALPERLAQEVAAMRTLIEEQLGQLAWSDALRRSPLRARFTRVLLAAGYSNALAREITQRLPDDFSATQAQDWLIGVLARNLRSAAAEHDLVNRGGVYALVGPTGVGKTTTTAKLAARCAVRFGAAKLALLTTDSYRVGAHDQLRIYAKILGVPVHTVSDRQDLRQALDSMRGKHLVLIDTVGMSQRDERVREQSMLLSQPEVKRLLLLNAAAQGETLEEVVGAYQRAPELGANAEIAGCVLTKIDEAGQLGQALDVLIRHRLLLHYTSSGQRVPEDLHEPSPNYLVHRSLRRPAKPSAFTLDDDAFTLLTGARAEALHA